MSVPASWLPDPTGRFQLRYWDGSQWSDHVSNAGVQGGDPVGPQPAAPLAAPPKPAAGGSWMDRAKAAAQDAADAASRAVDSASTVVNNQADQWSQEYKASQSPTAGQGGGVPQGQAPVGAPPPTQAPPPTGAPVGNAPVPGHTAPVPGSAPAPAAPTSSGGHDTADQIRKLSELRDQGVLTEDEFNAKKSQILGS